MIALTRTKSIAVTYHAHIDGQRIGEIAAQDDNSFGWWPHKEPGTSGYWSADVLRQVTDELVRLEKEAKQTRYKKQKRTDKPETIVMRLRGEYPTAVEPYPMTELHYEAAREIERLRGELAVSQPMEP